jgi:hypothetical protein
MTEYEDEVEEVIIEEEPKPGLLILDMTKDDMKGIPADTRDNMIENCRQLALSDFFHVCVESKVECSKFRLRPGGGQLIDTLKGMDHLNHFPRKNEADSALVGTKILETFHSIGITHVCVCGTSTESSILATIKDLVQENFQIFVVKDATYSKNGASNHEKGLSDITTQIGPDVIVSIDDLLGDDEDIEEEIVNDDEYIEEIVEDEYDQQQQGKETLLAVPSPAPLPEAAPTTTSRVVSPTPRTTTPSVPVKDLRVKTFIPPPKEVKKAPGPMTDAEKAEEMRRRDAEKLAARKAKFDAARFAHIETANTKAQDQAMVFQKRLEEKKIQGAIPYQPTVPCTAYQASIVTSAAKINETPQNQRKGWKLFHKKEEDSTNSSESNKNSRFTQLKAPPPIAARSVKPAGPVEVTPGWASIEKTKERPRPQVHSSEPYYPVSPLSPGLAVPPAPVPLAFKKHAEMEKPAKYQTVGYGKEGSGVVKTQLPGVNVSGSITTLQGNGLKTSYDGPRRMKTAKVTVDTKESFDAYGNLIRTVTRNITEPDGTKRSETEIIEIPKTKK